MAKAILRNTEMFTAVKVWGTGAAETITLNADLLVPNRLVLDGGTQTVNIVSLTWSGVDGSSVKITRGGTDIIVMPGAGAAKFTFDDLGFVDTVNNTANLLVTVTGDAYVYIGLKKQAGYKQTVEPSIYGGYDNPTIVDTPVNPNP